MKKLLFLIGFASLTMNAQVPSYVPTNGLLSYWPFSGNANDVSGNANNGTNNGAALTNDRFGNANSAYDFNGTSSNIVVPHNASLNTFPITISAWCKGSSSLGGGIVSKYVDCSSNGWSLHSDFAKISGYYYPSSGSNDVNFDGKTGAQSINDNTWHHLVATYDTTGGQLFYDGKLIMSQSAEYELDKTKFGTTALPGDTPVNIDITYNGGGVANMWDGGYMNWPRVYLTQSYIPGPHTVTIDTGVLTKMSRIKIWDYPEYSSIQPWGRIYYNLGDLKDFEIWGSPTAPTDASLDGWTKLGTYHEVKPSGLPLGQQTNEDYCTASAGFSWNFDATAPPVRYIKIKSISNWTGLGTISIAEIKIFGAAENIFPSSTLSDLYFGYKPPCPVTTSCTNNYFQGQIDDIGFWDRVLTPEEISSLYASSLGVNDFKQNTAISIYPNPANDHITIDCGTLATADGYHVEIINTLGQVVFNQAMSTQKHTISLNSWSGKGIYFVKVFDKNKNVLTTKKLILQ